MVSELPTMTYVNGAIDDLTENINERIAVFAHQQLLDSVVAMFKESLRGLEHRIESHKTKMA